jgi:hypothetical protein
MWLSSDGAHTPKRKASFAIVRDSSRVRACRAGGCSLRTHRLDRDSPWNARQKRWNVARPAWCPRVQQKRVLYVRYVPEPANAPL